MLSYHNVRIVGEVSGGQTDIQTYRIPENENGRFGAENEKAGFPKGALTDGSQCSDFSGSLQIRDQRLIETGNALINDEAAHAGSIST